MKEFFHRVPFPAAPQGSAFGKGLTPPGSVNGEHAEDNEAFLAGQVALSVHWNAAYQTLDAEDSLIHGKIVLCFLKFSRWNTVLLIRLFLKLSP